MTPTQLATLKAYIDATPELAAIPANLDGSYAVAAAMNLDASPAFTVWRTNVPVDEITNQIAWANLTPADAPDGTQAWANRSLACQGKQFNLQLIIAGRALIPGNLANIRTGLQDALTGVPSGTGGATQAANWVGVRDALKRNATVFEKVFAAGTGSFASPATMALEGPVSPGDVATARSL